MQHLLSCILHSPVREPEEKLLFAFTRTGPGASKEMCTLLLAGCLARTEHCAQFLRTFGIELSNEPVQFHLELNSTA